MIQRQQFLDLIQEYSEIFPITAVVGPRQCGKTTLALMHAKQYQKVMHLDMEDPVHYAQMQDPKLALESTSAELVIIDEIQKCPHLFPYLRVHVDRFPHSRFLILGSSSPDLLRQGSESLAGRVGYIELTPFSGKEVGISDTLWHRGGFPKSYMASTDRAAFIWLNQYISTFLEKDMAAMDFHVSTPDMRKLWMMAAHYHANLVNYSELARSLNISETTVRRYLRILESSFMLRLLKPWHENMSKRQVKAPKLYMRDSGVWHALMSLSAQEVLHHPKVGASWEGFALEEVIRLHQVRPEECYFWRTHEGAELDLLLCVGGHKLGFEFKYGHITKLTPSMRIALEDLNLEKITVVIPGDTHYKLAQDVEVFGLQTLSNEHKS